MAQYTVTADCIYIITIQLYGPESDRSRRIAWMEGPGGKCNACYAASKRAEEANRGSAEVETIARQLRDHAAQITAEVAAKWRAEIAAGKGSEAKRQAAEIVLAELGF
jgi:hypothetical protein